MRLRAWGGREARAHTEQEGEDEGEGEGVRGAIIIVCEG